MRIASAPISRRCGRIFISMRPTGSGFEQAIPAHAGLGSGTQLAFALAAGLRRLEGLPEDFAG